VVRHRRAAPPTYELEHRVFYLALDLDELDEVPRRIWPIGRNRPSLLGFRDADHFHPPAADLRAAVLDHLAGRGRDTTGWQVTLVTNLRVAGYVFNPASFYLCRDRGGVLRTVIVEVHNTHGERHLYTLDSDAEGPSFRASMDKAFYVSPFLDVVGTYAVHVRDEPHRLRVTINESKDGVLQLHASTDLVRRPLTTRALLAMLLRHPFMTQRTIGLIHLHALRLWRRGATFFPHHRAAP
jgi:DUF1365 family protein